ncbi:Uncharacterised protein [Staphylococcus aureus]|nr:Hypothetical protein FORC45_0026 [Staphylococcus aureus]ELY16602.1 hypothetical protein C429_0823 [Staphylococcus aureus KT/314250]CAC5516719.1 Uncharacterised protein [Staphylococcus aureus]CAC5687629.1 Uncharacterised protein [Staphylococcus aureus]CAC5886660.1 Uncharacterised protein [Staphylococcus aureus]
MYGDAGHLSSRLQLEHVGDLLFHASKDKLLKIL